MYSSECQGIGSLRTALSARARPSTVLSGSTFVSVADSVLSVTEFPAEWKRAAYRLAPIY